MSLETDRNEPNPVAAESDSPLFPATPIWDRANRKRGRSGARAAAEPRSVTAVETPTTRPAPLPTDRQPLGFTPALPAMDAEEPAMMPPIARTRTLAPRSRGGAGGAVVVAGFAALAIAGAGGWYLMQNQDPVPELTPGAVEIAAAQPMAAPPAALAPPPVEAAPAVTPPSSEPAPAARVERRAPAPRARPATAPSAATSGKNASAVLPDAPLPYGAVNQSAAPTVPTPVNPAPAPQTAAPESLPSTPPTAPDPAPAAPTPEATPLTTP